MNSSEKQSPGRPSSSSTPKQTQQGSFTVRRIDLSRELKTAISTSAKSGTASSSKKSSR